MLNFKSDFSKNVSDSNTFRIHPGIYARIVPFFFFRDGFLTMISQVRIASIVSGASI